MRSGGRSLLFVAALSIPIISSRDALALQPLDELVRAARSFNLDNREAALTAAQRVQEVGLAWARIAPAFTGRAMYTRNQYQAEASIPTSFGPNGPTETKSAVITAQNQYDLSLTLDVPLVDLGAWSRIRAARSTSEAAETSALATEIDVEKAVTQMYLRAVAAEALVVAAQSSLDAAVANRAVVAERKTFGTISELDVDRAAAAVERARQSLVDAEYTRSIAARTLRTLTGLQPTPGAPPLEDRLDEEAPLDVWLSGRSEDLPAIRAAALGVKAAEETTTESWEALLPALSATASERFTNAVGFGTSPYYALGVALSWRLDFVSYESARVEAAREELARVRLEKAEQTTRDAIHDAWQQVRSQIAKSRAARAEAKASAHAADLAHQRYATGTATQLEVIDADRDSFSSEVARIQADADLVYARALLRLTAGRDVRTEGAAR